MSDSIDKYIGNTMLNTMPKTAEITHNEWLLGKVPDSDLDTSYEQINVTFPYWQKHIKNETMDFGCIRISKDLEKELNVMMKKNVNVDKKYYELKKYIPALLQSLADESK